MTTQQYLKAGLIGGIAMLTAVFPFIACAQQAVSETEMAVPAAPAETAADTSSYLVQGILPAPGRHGFDNYFSSAPGRRHGAVLTLPGSKTNGNTKDQSGLMWFEANSDQTANKGLSAQFGIGYSPNRAVGFAFGPVVELNGSLGHHIGTSGTDDEDYLVTPTLRNDSGISGAGFNGETGSDSAGLAASLSYMPFEDLWVGIHGRLTSDLTSSSSSSSTDRFDAMLGLTAGYRLQF
ncbi:hypothetical protein [Thalassospira mesophila]|uniref:Outer membrane protein beta-barrel domain-containing protein n=1 Tax=Thalassospira mesophila TaxID=1293891 RepID=A0A1Y2L2J9_9PROT|nr:hypothetical protein [Thalassospira mesophila]OSQ39434.1 hypothetical protein TMES_05120 [Thalassospira mesophila]